MAIPLAMLVSVPMDNHDKAWLILGVIFLGIAGAVGAVLLLQFS